MSKLTLDEAIKHCLEVADQEEQLSKTGKWFEGEDWNVKAREYYAECATDHRQLAEWLRELKEAKRLLKLAVEDIESLRPYLAEPYSHTCNEKWRYADEALKLIES